MSSFHCPKVSKDGQRSSCLPAHKKNSVGPLVQDKHKHNSRGIETKDLTSEGHWLLAYLMCCKLMKEQQTCNLHMWMILYMKGLAEGSCIKGPERGWRNWKKRRRAQRSDESMSADYGYVLYSAKEDDEEDSGGSDYVHKWSVHHGWTPKFQEKQFFTLDDEEEAITSLEETSPHSSQVQKRVSDGKIKATHGSSIDVMDEGCVKMSMVIEEMDYLKSEVRQQKRLAFEEKLEEEYKMDLPRLHIVATEHEELKQQMEEIHRKQAEEDQEKHWEDDGVDLGEDYPASGAREEIGCEEGGESLRMLKFSFELAQSEARNQQQAELIQADIGKDYPASGAREEIGCREGGENLSIFGNSGGSFREAGLFITEAYELLTWQCILQTVATVCMFLAGKVEETPRPLRDVIFVSYEISNKKDPTALQRIKQKEVYEQQKEIILLGERVVLATLGFDLNVHHPYKPLVAAIKKFKVAQNALAQVAWNFVNDGLRTSLFLQFKPHHVAAGAIFLAAKFLKVKLPSDGDKVWWQEFGVTPRQLEEVSNQMLELYEQNRATSTSRGTEPGGNSGMNNCQKPGNIQSNGEAPPSANGHSQVPQYTSPAAAQPVTKAPQAEDANDVTEMEISDDDQNLGKYDVGIKQNSESVNADNEQACNKDQGLTEENVHSNQPSRNAIAKQVDKDHDKDTMLEDVSKHDLKPSADSQSRQKVGQTVILPDESTFNTSQNYDKKEPAHSMVNYETHANKSRDEIRGRLGSDDTEQKKSWAGFDEVNKDKVKAALEKRRRFRGEGIESRPAMPRDGQIDEDDLIERELESGVEAAAEAEKAKQDRKEDQSKSLSRGEQERSELEDVSVDETENRGKRKRSNENTLPEKRRTRPSGQPDPSAGFQDRVPAIVSYEHMEEGEFPISTVHKEVPSPKFSDRRTQMPNQPEKGGSSHKRHDYGGPDQIERRDLSYDKKHRHSNHQHHSSSHVQHQNRADNERDRYYYKDRDRQERDYKKVGHDHGK
eukprot:Gb_25727 [translate_table: standard]